MAKKLYSFVCRACNEHTDRHAKKTPEFCEECSSFRQAWTTMRAPSQWRERNCKNCGIYLHNCIYGGKAYCAECAAEKSRLKDRKNTERKQRARAPKLAVKCEGCGCGVRLSRQGVRHFCATCLAIDDRWRKDSYRNQRFGFIVEFDRKRKAELKAGMPAMRNYNAHVSAYKRHLSRQGKPWLEPGLSSGDRWRLRYRLDPDFHASERLRQSLRRKRRGKERNIAYWMRRAVKGKKASVSWAERFLGYSASTLRLHLERQFGKGMSWDKFVAGQIDIDHIVPVSSFDLTDEGQIKAAWSLSNLRPMWSKDNREKWAKRTHLI